MEGMWAAVPLPSPLSPPHRLPLARCLSQVHPWTFRDEARFVLEQLDGAAGPEYALFLGRPQGQEGGGEGNQSDATAVPAQVPAGGLLPGVDGVFSDYPSSAVGYLEDAALRGQAHWDLPAANREPKQGQCLLTI